MDTELLYLALAVENLFDCIRLDNKDDWENLTENDCRY